MKLNKPEISKAQTELEEYVDFLLTDLTNVTPIDSKRKSKVIPSVKKLSLADKEEPAFSTIAEVDDYLNKAIDEPKNESENTIEKAAESQLDAENMQSLKSEHVTNENVIDEASSQGEQSLEEQNQDDQSLNEQNQNKPVESKTTSSKAIGNQLKPKQPVSKQTPHKQALSFNDSENDIEYGSKNQAASLSSRTFELESEQDELKKWDAVLTKEKENQILSEHASQPFSATDKLANLSQAKPEAPPDQQGAVHQEPDQRLANVEQLLARISLATQTEVAPSQVPEESPARAPIYDAQPESSLAADTEQDEALLESSFIQRKTRKTRDILPEVFQTLLFNVGKMPLAVPLIKLGGIIHMDEELDITPLVGTPDWFLGLVPNDRGNLMVVDSRQFLMPEQQNDAEQSYEYLIVLDNSNWALACHSVGDAKNLTLNDIRWAEKSSKRPWFGGMVVEYMSALIEVDELINMLAEHISE